MKNYRINLCKNNGLLSVEIIRKNIKNVHLKVYRDLKIRMSIPQTVSDEWIIEFLEKKKKWIDNQITKYKNTRGNNNLLNIKNGSSTIFLGKDIRIYKKSSPINYISIDEHVVNMYLKNTDDIKFANKFFDYFWRKQAEKIFNEQLDKIYNRVFKKYKIKKPILNIRKMKTLWGSCTKTKNKITLNQYLLKADIRCIEYVILHELTHLLYTYHDKNFYNFLTIHMPDWRERKKQLDMDVVQGL